MNALPDQKPLRMMDSDMAAAFGYGLKLTGTDKATQMTFDAAVGQLGVRGLIECTTLSGYSRIIGLNASACTIDLA